MLLAIDIGNTDVVIGAFDGDDLVTTLRLHSDDRVTADELGIQVTQLLAHRGLAAKAVTAVAVSNVVPGLTRTVDDLCRSYFNTTPLVVGPGMRTGLRIQYDDPRQVGADRIVNAVAAHHKYGGPVIVIDFGTATTFDAVTATGDFVGGAIAPGLGVSAEALVSRAAKLSRVELVAPIRAIGKTTVVGMQSGIIYGYVGLVDGIVGRIKRELDGAARVIATGGLAGLIVMHTASIDVVDDRLTLDGLRRIASIQ